MNTQKVWDLPEYGGTIGFTINQKIREILVKRETMFIRNTALWVLKFCEKNT